MKVAERNDVVHSHVDNAGGKHGLRCGTMNHFSGWAVNLNPDNPIQRVQFSVGHSVLDTLPIDNERPDLISQFGKSRLGFWGSIMIPESCLNQHLAVEAISKDGFKFLIGDFVLGSIVPPEEKEFKRRHNLPDDRLMQLVVSDIDPYLFVQRGKEGVALIQTILRKNQIDFSLLRNVLDFGVGCGRNMKWWEGFNRTTVFWGTDINEQLIAWCRSNLTFANFSVNGLYPPMEFRDEKFDLIYAFSIFTHLTLQTQEAWLEEFYRVLAPKKYAIISVHGDKDAEQLSPESKAHYQRDGFVMISQSAEGGNMCATYENRTTAERLFAARFEIVDYLPASRVSTSNQDLYLLMKR